MVNYNNSDSKVRHYAADNGEEYVTRKQIAMMYDMPLTCLQRRLKGAAVGKIVEGTRFYFRLFDIKKLLKNQ